MAHASPVLCGVLVMIAVQSEPDSSNTSHRCSGSEASSGSRVLASFVCSAHPRGDSPTMHGKRSVDRYQVTIHRHQPLHTACAHTREPSGVLGPGDDSAPHKEPPLSVKVLTHRMRLLAFSGLEHFERPPIPYGLYQDRPPLRMIRQFSINKKRVTIRNNAIGTSFRTLVDIVDIPRTFDF
jgi:hypothetical protein